MNQHYLHMARHFETYEMSNPRKLTATDHYIQLSQDKYKLPHHRTPMQIAQSLTDDDKAILFDFGMRQSLNGTPFYSYITRLNQ